MPGLGYRTQATVLLLLVALAGVLAGVAGQRLLADRVGEPGDRGPARRGPPPGAGLWQWEPRPHEGYADRLAGRLDLSPEQRARINSILAEEQARVRALTRQVEPQFREIAEETRTRIESVLTNDQRAQLRELRDERRRGRRFRGPAEGAPRRR